MRRLHAVLGLAVLMLGPAGAARAEDAESQRLRRVAKVGQLWSEIRFRDPALLHEAIDWDAALVEALPKVEAARDAEGYAEAVRGMLAVLKDPLTRVEKLQPPRPPPAVNPRPLWGFEGDVLVLNLGAAPSHDVQAAATEQMKQAMGEAISRARAVVVDVRTARRAAAWELEVTLATLLPLLYSGEVHAPDVRSTLYSGYPKQTSISSGDYSVTLVQKAEVSLPGTSGPKPERVVFVLDGPSPVPPQLFGLYARGTGLFVAEGHAGEETLGLTERMDLGEGLAATFRLGEPSVPFLPDARVPERSGPSAKDEAMDVALKLARSRGALHARPEAPPAKGTWRPDPKYPEMLYPDRAHRQYAALKLWNVIRLFDPYLPLLGDAWDGALVRLLPKFEAARDAAGYARAVLELAAQVKDGHVTVKGHPEVVKLLGDAPPPFEMLELEGQPVVVRINLASAVPGLKVGDVVEAVDGVPVAERVKALGPYIPSSTDAHRRYLTLRAALAGPDGSGMTLRVRDASGSHEVKGRRDKLAQVQAMPGKPYRLLPGNVGFVDMLHMLPADIEPMKALLGGTRGLVLDLRGYPKMSGYAVAGWLTVRKAKVAARFERNLVGPEGVQRMRFDQPPVPAVEPTYRGRVTVLLDERAISQSEHVCLDFEVVNPAVTFVGSPTAGANGDMTDVVLPGAVVVTFSGHEVRHADGRQLQQVGIQPHVPARPTIAGLRAGRDEVLERALGLLGADASPAAEKR